MAQKSDRKIPIQACIIVPEACPGEFELTCGCCGYSDKEFRFMKPEQGTGLELGSVTCRFGEAKYTFGSADR